MPAWFALLSNTVFDGLSMIFVISQPTRDYIYPLLRENLPDYLTTAVKSTDGGDLWWVKYPLLEADPQIKGWGIPSWWTDPPEGAVRSSNE